MPKPRMMFYNDGRHPLIYLHEPPMQREEYEAAVDQLIGTPIDALMFCMGDGRTVLHDTKVGELWGHNVERWHHLIFNRAHRNARHLIEEGNDPLRIVCDRAHAKGMLFYATLLVQSRTGDRAADVRGSDFRFDHRHLDIGAAGDVDPSFPGFGCIDFKHQEIRDERLALIEETLERYPVDGFELQLNQTPYYFHPNEVEQGREIMTDWIARVHSAVKSSGQERELVVRVPASIEGCLSVGLDVREWIRRGIVDVVVGNTFAGPELIDPMADFRPLVEAAKGSDCRIHAAIHSLVDSDRLAHAPTEMARATASNYWAQGVDGLYLAYWHGLWPFPASFYEKLRELSDPEVMAPKDKHYHVLTQSGRFPEPTAEPGVTRQLPVDLEEGQPAQIQLFIADDLPRWDRVGRVHEVLLRMRVANATELDRYSFKLNGKELPDRLLRVIDALYGKGGPRYRTRGYWFVFRLDSEHWPKRGVNTLEATLVERDPDVTPKVYLRDVELEIKYLMGKRYHRGFVDPDLGQYDGG